MSKPRTAAEREVFEIWQGVDPSDAFVAGLSEYAGTLLIPTPENVADLRKRIDGAMSRCETDSQRKLLACLHTSLSLQEPPDVPGDILDTFFAHLVKEGIRVGHMLTLTACSKSALSAYLEANKGREWPLGQRLLATINCDGLFEVLHVVRRNTKSSALKRELSELLGTAKNYAKHFRVDGFKTGSFDEVWGIIREKGCALGRQDAYPAALKDLYDYHETPSQVEESGLSFLNNELGDYKKLVGELASELDCEGRSEAVKQVIERKKSVPAKRIIPFINQVRKLIVKIVRRRVVGVNPKYRTKVMETPRYLSGILPSGAAFSQDYLTRNPKQIFLATTDPRRDPSTVPAEIINTLVHEEYGHCVHSSNSAVAYGARPEFIEMLGSSLGGAVSEGISFQRELEFMDCLNGMSERKKFTREERTFLRVCDRLGGFETLRREYEFFTKTWRIVRFLRVIGDARINSGKQDLADFIEWANKETGLSKSTVYFQLFPAHQAIGPGYATTYAILGERVREIQTAAIEAGKDLVKFNTYASSLGFPPRSVFESKLYSYIKS